jgi:hypothetical protein
MQLIHVQNITRDIIQKNNNKYEVIKTDSKK